MNKALKYIIKKFINSNYSLFFLFFILAKYLVFQKANFDYVKVENDFFPDFLYLINPFYLDFLIVSMLIIRNKILLFLTVFFSFIQIIHPVSFGIQNYVVSFYVLLWLFINELNPQKPQIFFGRIIVSFVFIGAFIGKLTPGWISGEHPAKYLTHIKHFANIPYLFVVGEFLVAISFIYPFLLGVIIPLLIILGMIFSISFLIFDAVGPLIGLLLTLMILKYNKKSSLTVYFDKNCGICMRVYKIFKTINSNYINLKFLQEIGSNIDKNKANIYIASESNNGVFYGYDTYKEIFARIPVLSILYPLLSVRIVSNIGKYIYLKVANQRTCKI